MEERPSNEGMIKRDLSKYKKMEMKEISDAKMKRLLGLKKWEALQKIECMAFDVKFNVKKLGTDPLTATSADFCEIDIEHLIYNPDKEIRAKGYTANQKPKIDKMIEKEKSKRKEALDRKEREERAEKEKENFEDKE